MPIFKHANGSSNSTHVKSNATSELLLKEAAYAQTYNDSGISIEDLPADEEVTVHI